LFVCSEHQSTLFTFFFPEQVISESDRADENIIKGNNLNKKEIGSFTLVKYKGTQNFS
jgi:hypothetical protein